MARWETFLDRMVEGDAPPIPFMKTLALPDRLVSWEPGRIRQEWLVNPDVFHPRGAVFGGFLAALADRSCFLTAMTELKDDEAVSTSDLDVSFLRAVSEGTLHIEGRVIHRGRTSIRVEVEFRRDDGKLAVKASASEAIIPVPEGFDLS